MKTKIYNCLGIKPSVNLIKKVHKLIPDQEKEVYLMTVGMSWKSRGSYDYFLKLVVDGEEVTLREHTHDSTAYDYYTELEAHTVKFDNWCKNVCLMLIENNSQTILNNLLLNELYLLTEKEQQVILSVDETSRYLTLVSLLETNGVEIPFDYIV